ncbi:MAG: hypothetical protein V4579_10185 [Pseudomonadota bacterium]
MRNFSTIGGALVGGLIFAAHPVHAKEPSKEELWAQCLWHAVPRSAANWLGMADIKSDFGSTNKSPKELLEFRLQAACFDKLKPAGKKFPIGFFPKKVRAALESSRPTSIGQDTTDPKAFQCVRFFTRDVEMKTPAAFKWGFGDFDKGHAFARVSYVFAAQGGGGVGLPETGGLYKCHWIKEDGTLTNA